MKVIASTLLLISIAVLFSCHRDFYPFAGDGEEQDETDFVMDPRSDVPVEEAEVPPSHCIPIGVDDNCNEIDDDCNGIVDDKYNKMQDPDNCGVCGMRCSGINEIYECMEGHCTFIECQPGFADLDPQQQGCEYRCPVYPPMQENCNGIDDDCDGEIDEPQDLQPPPGGLCRDTPGTPCEGTEIICATRGNPPTTTWYCNYREGVEFDPSVPSGIVMEETLCDGMDGDCDGMADDIFSDLGLECDNGLMGACRDVGRKVCNPSDPYSTICDLTFPPDPVNESPVPEECNGIDDDCDGIIDNSEGDGRVIDDMVEISIGGLHFWIYRFEASRPDATATSQGIMETRTCSRRNVMPWTFISFDSAESACRATGKRLCTAEEFTVACSGSESRIYPYGNDYNPDLCNGLDFDGIPGGDDDDVLLPTGSSLIEGCVSSYGIYDLSGNAKEWTNEIAGDSGPPDHIPIAVTRGGSYQTPEIGLKCAFDLARASITTKLASIGFRCCSDNPP